MPSTFSSPPTTSPSNTKQRSADHHPTEVSSYNGKGKLTRVSNAQFILDGSVRDINTLISTQHIIYQLPAGQASLTTPVAYLHFTLDDRGWSTSTTVTPAILSTTTFLPINYPYVLRNGLPTACAQYFLAFHLPEVWRQ